MPRKYVNPIKEKLRKSLSDVIIKNKIDFDEIWNKSMKMSVGFIGGKRNIFNQKYSEIASYLTREKILEEKYKTKSFFSRYEEQEGKSYEKFYKAAFQEYFDRTENLREKYGNDIIFYNDEELTLNEWFEKFSNKEISQTEMNEIIEELHKTNETYLKQNYNGTSQNEDISNFFDL